MNHSGRASGGWVGDFAGLESRGGDGVGSFAAALGDHGGGTDRAGTHRCCCLESVWRFGVRFAIWGIWDLELLVGAGGRLLSC